MITELIEWHGLPGIRYRGDRLEMVVLPARGGKIASLRDWTGREWLAQPPLPLAPESWPTELFTDGDMCGWDECAPTIIPCEVAGTHLPDHGDLWRRSWRAEGDQLVVDGSAWNYTFSRRITIDGPHIRVDYKVTTNTGIPAFLWAAHPQFSANPETLIALPESVKELLDVSDFDAEPQPLLTGEDRLWVGSIASGQGRKFYIPPDTTPAWVALRHASGHELRLSWTAQAPFLGIWIDRGAYAPDDVVALEPSTGFYDSCERALRLGRIPAIKAGDELRWSLSLTVRADCDGMYRPERDQS